MRRCTCYDYPAIIMVGHDEVGNNPPGIEGKDYRWVKKDKIWTHLDGRGNVFQCEDINCRGE